jgi:hypothetical protein
MGTTPVTMARIGLGLVLVMSFLVLEGTRELAGVSAIVDYKEA